MTKGKGCVGVESVKTSAEVYSPVNGVINEVNSILEKPERLQEDPEGNGWLVKIAVKDVKALSGLMDSESYKKYLAEECN